MRRVMSFFAICPFHHRGLHGPKIGMKFDKPLSIRARLDLSCFSDTYQGIRGPCPGAISWIKGIGIIAAKRAIECQAWGRSIIKEISMPIH
jgi:hypothetical protein